MKGRRAWALASAVAAALSTAVYLTLITIEGNNSYWDVLPWALLMVVGAAASLGSAVSRRPAVSRGMAIGAAVVLGAVGVAAILSVGSGFVVAAVLAGVAATKTAPQAAGPSLDR